MLVCVCTDGRPATGSLLRWDCWWVNGGAANVRGGNWLLGAATKVVGLGGLPRGRSLSGGL